MSFESTENEPISKERVVEMLKAKGAQDREALEILSKFTEQKENQFTQEGRKDAKLEGLRERAHTLRLADCFAEAIEVINEVMSIAQNKGDSESYEEAQWILEKLRSHMVSNMETTDSVSREEVVDAFRKVIEKGLDPYAVNKDNLDLVEAQRLLDDWSKRRELEVQGNINGQIRLSVERSMILVDAGLTDKVELEEILSEIHANDADIEKIPEDVDRVEVRKYIADSMKKIRAIIAS